METDAIEKVFDDYDGMLAASGYPQANDAFYVLEIARVELVALKEENKKLRRELKLKDSPGPVPPSMYHRS